MMSDQKTLADLFNAIAPPRECQHYSIGHICQLLNIVPSQLEILMRDAEVRFTSLIDGILYVDGTTMQKLTEAFNRIVTEINDAAKTIEAAANN